MRNNTHFTLFQSIVREFGATVTNSPTIEHPIPVPVFYRNNPDGSVGYIWPKGSRNVEFSVISGLGEKSTAMVKNLIFTLGLEGILAHGRLVLYADLPTATYLQRQWMSSKVV